MNDAQLFLSITSFADGAPLPADEEARVRNAIDNNPHAAFAYMVQNGVKRAVRQKCSRVQLPAARKADILNNIYSQTPAAAAIKPRAAITFSYWAARAAAVVLLTVSVLLLYSSLRGGGINTEPHDGRYLDIAAADNFNRLLQGSLLPQFSSSDASGIASFFKRSGIDYETRVPEVAGFTLQGAVVSTERGGKFAHHVYSSADGKLLYCLQIKRDHITRTAQFALTESLLNFLDSGNAYQCSINGRSCYFREENGSVFAFISDAAAPVMEASLTRCTFK